MSNNLTHPLIRIRVWWNYSSDNPALRLGVKEAGINRLSQTVQWDTPNKRIYQLADFFALAILRNSELHFRAEVNRNYLYRDLTEARREHYQRQRPAPTVNNYEQERQRRESARAKAAQLLTEQTSPAFAEGIQSERCFYFHPHPWSHRYIIDPYSRNVIRLDEEHPTGLCILFKDSEVQRNLFDWGVGIYLYLKGAPQHLHSTANEYRSLRSTQWYTEECGPAEPNTVSTEGMLS
jgi:hypothetical protein